MVSYEPTRLGARIQALRTARRLTIYQVAQQAGITPSALSFIERGRTIRPEAETIAGISAAFGITPQELLEGTGMTYPSLLPAKSPDQSRTDYIIERLTTGSGMPRIVAEATDYGIEPLPLLSSLPKQDWQEAIEMADAVFRCTEQIAKAADFVLQVKGDSLYPRIEDGDFVGFKLSDDPAPGQVVAALNAKGEVAFKIFRQDKRGRSRLESPNPNYPPIRSDFKVIAVATWWFGAENPEDFIESKEEDEE